MEYFCKNMHIFVPLLNKYTHNILAMTEKVIRQRKVREIVEKEKVSSQEEILDYLLQAGIATTQATLSRDIRELRIVKVHDGEEYSYSLPHPSPQAAVTASNRGINMGSVSIDSVEFCGQLMVLRTRPGHAGMVALLLDNAKLKEVAGTVAGEDSVFAAIRDDYSPDDVIESLEKVFKGVRKKRVN